MQNGIITHDAIVSPVETGSLLSYTIGISILMLSFLGLISLVKSQNSRLQFLGQFTITSLGIYIVFVLGSIFTLSPTRHNLILLSFSVFLTPIGLSHFIGFVWYRTKSVIFTFSYILLFLISYGSIQTKRIDKFDETKFEALISEYDVTELWSLDYTGNHLFTNVVRRDFKRLGFPKGSTIDSLSIVQQFKNRNFGCLTKHYKPEALEKERVILIYSHRAEIETNLLFQGNSKLLYQYANVSDVQISPSTLTKNGSNSLYLKIIKVIPEKNPSIQ